MSTKTVSPTFRMSRTCFRELSEDTWPAELPKHDTKPSDYVDDLFSYAALFNDPAIGELVWRIVQANRNNGSADKWLPLNFADLIRAMRTEPLSPTTHARSSDYRAFGIMQKYCDSWDYYMEVANNDLIASRDLMVYEIRFIYPSAQLLAKMVPLLRPTPPPTPTEIRLAELAQASA